MPDTYKLRHLRPKTFKQEMFKMREIQNENDNLVLKILKIRGGSKINSAGSAMSPMMSSHKKRRFGSVRRSSSARSVGN